MLCANLAGTTVPLERRRELYKVAQDWNLIIIEDDAYYYLQYPNGAGEHFFWVATLMTCSIYLQAGLAFFPSNPGSVAL